MLTALFLLTLGAWQAPAQKPNPARDPAQLFNDAVQAQLHGDYQTAIRDYRSVLEIQPKSVEARVNLGAALVKVGQFDAGIEEYKAALPLIQDKNGVLMNIGLAYYKKGDWPDAREQFTVLAKDRPADVRIAILLGDTDLKLGDDKGAVALLSPLAAANSDNADFDFFLGTALVRTGKRREGVDLLEKAASLSNGVDAWVLAGTTLLEMADYQHARKDLDTAIGLNSGLPAAIYSLAGEARDRNGDAESAEIAFREALKRDPGDFKANLYLGAILLKRRDLDAAKPYLDRALVADPKSSMAHYEDAMLKSATKDYQPAAQELEQLVKDDPNWLEPHIELATLYYKLHRPEDGAKERQIVDRITAEQQKKGPQ